MKADILIAKLKLVTVEPVLFLYMMIIFMENNALQELIFVKACLSLLKPVNVSECGYSRKDDLPEVLRETTHWTRFNGAFLFSFTLLSSFYVASWSDKLGRKFPMIIPPIGTIIAASINCALSVFITSHIAYFFLSSAISGLTFGSVGIIACTFGFISDITDEHFRTRRIVILEAMIFMGGTLGIYVGGKFLHDIIDYEYRLNGFAKLFIFEICVSCIISTYTILRIPDGQYTATTCGRLFSLNHIRDSLKTVFRSREHGKRKSVFLLLLSLLLIYFGSIAQLSLAYYFVKNLKWSFPKYSNFNSIQFAVEGAALLLGLPVLFQFFQIPDHFIAILGLLSRTAGFIVFGLSSNDAMVYSCAALCVFSEFPVPAIRSMLSKLVDADEKGRIFAFTTILQNFCYLLGSLILVSVFNATEHIFPGLSFEIVAVLQALAMIIIIYLYMSGRDVVTAYEIMENEDGSIDETVTVIKSESINC